jgi:hypothetical protein
MLQSTQQTSGCHLALRGISVRGQREKTTQHRLHQTDRADRFRTLFRFCDSTGQRDCATTATSIENEHEHEHEHEHESGYM